MLTDIQLKKAKAAEKDYKLADGGGLHVLVSTTGNRSWRLKYRFGKKARADVIANEIALVGEVGDEGAVFPEGITRHVAQAGGYDAIARDEAGRVVVRRDRAAIARSIA
jgi:hypothetical protein